MDFFQAVEKANNAMKSREKWPGDYRFSSAICVLESEELKKWTIIYSVEGDNEVINVLVSESVRMEKAKAPNFKEYKEIKFSQINIGPQEIMNKAREIVSAYNQVVTKEIIALRQEAHPVWKVVSFTNKLGVIILEFDAVTGKLLNERTESLIRSL